MNNILVINNRNRACVEIYHKCDMVCVFLYKLLPHESFLDGTVILALTKEVRLINEAHVGEVNFHDTPMRSADVHNKFTWEGRLLLFCDRYYRRYK